MMLPLQTATGPRARVTLLLFAATLGAATLCHRPLPPEQAAQLGAQAGALDPQQALAKGKEFYDKKEYAQAAPFVTRAAEGGVAEAQMMLGKMFFNGWGVPHSHEKAKEWHEKAAAQGNAESIEKLKALHH